MPKKTHTQIIAHGNMPSSRHEIDQTNSVYGNMKGKLVILRKLCYFVIVCLILFIHGYYYCPAEKV